MFSSGIMKAVYQFIFLFLTLGSFPLLCLAQHEEPPLPKDPTPLIQLVSEQEKAAIAKESKPKNLVEVYLKIADTHIEAAYNAAKNSDARMTQRELDIYNKALDESAKIAFTITDDRRKLSKKIEQNIYKNLKTLELVGRYSPDTTLPFVDFAMNHAKQIRTQAINVAFDSGTVLHEKNGEAKTPEESSLQRITFKKPAPAFLEPRRFSSFVSRSPQFANDYLTEEEDDFVRQAQEPDLRMKVFMKIADRRLLAITGESQTPTDKKDAKKLEEEEKKWGKLPQLDRIGYLRHYAKAVDEAMAKLDDAYERNPKASSVEKALKVLSEATDRQLKTLHALEADMKTEKEKDALSDAIEKAETANKGASSGLKRKETKSSQ